MAIMALVILNFKTNVILIAITVIILSYCMVTTRIKY